MKTDKEPPEWLATPFGVLLIIEFIALLIALALPITPSKTGGDNDLAKYFIEDPTYLEKVLVAFIVTNLLIGVIAVVAYVYHRISQSRQTDR